MTAEDPSAVLAGALLDRSPAYGAGDWPIAAGMLQFRDVVRGGTPTREATPQQWRDALAPVAHEGFTALELSNRWLDLARVPAARRAELAGVCRALGLQTPGYVVVGRSIMHPADRSENIAYTHASIDAAADVGVGVVCVGLHSVSLTGDGGAEWFWTLPGGTFGTDPEDRHHVVLTMRDLGRHAAERGVQLSLEMFPGTHVGLADDAVALIEDIAHPAVGLNPDVGNLVRVQGPVENWRDVLVKTLPLTNYWHVKNYTRAEVPQTGFVMTHPTSLELGIIDYRLALSYAVSCGFRGTLVTEHYGGDGLGVAATNREYLRRLLGSIIALSPAAPPV